MSILFHESDSRLFKSNASNSNQSDDEHRLFTDASSLTKSTNNRKVSTFSSQVNTRPKIPSNLVRSSTSCSNSFDAEQEAANSREHSLSLNLLTRDQLVDSVNEKQNVLFAARNEYVQHYENFYSITRKFHLEDRKSVV